VEFGLPDLESRAQIFQIHTRTMNCERDIRFELLARCGLLPALAPCCLLVRDIRFELLARCGCIACFGRLLLL
jgi:SpoVK/Ycf46/Vps4 family AAA+-type ATPase